MPPSLRSFPRPPAPSGGTARAGSNGVWFDPALGAPPAGPKFRPFRNREKFYSMSRMNAAMRVKERRRELKHLTDAGATQIWASGSNDLGVHGLPSPPSAPVPRVAERISPTNPLRPHASLPFKPNATLPINYARRPEAHRPNRKVPLVLDQVEGVGAPAPKTPKNLKASSRSTARSTGRAATSTRDPASPKSKSGDKRTARSSTTKAAAVDAAASASTGDDDPSTPAAEGTTLSDAKDAKPAKAEASAEMRAIASLTLTAAELREIAQGFERTGAARLAVVGSFESLPLTLGQVLMDKMDAGIKEGAQAFFRELDANGDGTVTRIEFKQMMRKLGLVGDGAQYSPKSVDALFSELDEDGGGELDLTEITAALKKLKAKANRVQKREAEAKADAEYWRGRAEDARAAAKLVGEQEDLAKQLHECRTAPAADIRLANLLAKKQVKPADLVDKMDNNKDGKIDQKEWVAGLRALGIDASPEELSQLFNQLDVNNSGTLEIDEIKLMVSQIHAVKERAKEQEKRLVRELARAEQEAKEVKSRIQEALLADQRKKEEAEAEAVRSQEEKRLAAEAAERDAKAKQEAKMNWEKVRQAEFQARIEAKRKK